MDNIIMDIRDLSYELYKTNQIQKASSDMDIRDLSYELYKIDWMRRISPERQMDLLKNYYQNTTATERRNYPFEEYVLDIGYDGKLYAYKDEFIASEYTDTEYMKKLLDNETLFAEYKKDRGLN